MDPQFGKLTTFSAMQDQFKKLRSDSRRQLLNSLYRKNNDSQQQIPVPTTQVEQDLSNAFVILLGNYSYKRQHPIVQKIMDLFDLKLSDLDARNKQQKLDYIRDKILTSIERTFRTTQQHETDKHQELNINKGADLRKTSNYYLQPNGHTNPEKNQFQWVGVKSNFPQLKPIFDQILLEKVRMFDTQLTEITKLYEGRKCDTEDIFTTARTLDQPSEKLQRSKTLMVRKSQLKSQIEKKGFCDVLIRDRSHFSLNKWSKKEEDQFQQKKKLFKNNFGKDKQLPIIFQFVKKYTTTIKARDNIYKKWEHRQKTGITPQELKYLCSTSLFLNRTLTKSQQTRIRHNVESLGKNLLSKLEFNIAEKIIETYKVFTKRVSDLRANYYQNLTENRKREYSINRRKEKAADKLNISKTELKKYKETFTRICEGQKMKLRLNFKVYRWVRLFADKLIERIDEKSKKRRRPVRNQLFIKLASSRSAVPSLLLQMKRKHPSSKIIKREDHSHYRNLAMLKTVPSTERFYYEKPFEEKIRFINSVRVKNQESFRSQISGGPSELGKDIIKVDLSKKRISYTSQRCLKLIVLIQAYWKKEYQRKIYLDLRDKHRQQAEADFKARLVSLHRIYPEGSKIDFKSIKNRLKRVSMRTLSVFKPYERNNKKPINLYTSFSKTILNFVDLKAKTTKNSTRRMAQFCNFVENNQYTKLRQSGFVVTANEINNPICQEGASPMWWAVKNSNVQLTKKFLEGGGDPNAANFDLDTCMHVAVQNGNIQICFLLLDYGADLNFKNKSRATPLYFATPKLLKWLGVQQASVLGTSESLKDNNSLFFSQRKISDIYQDHLY